MHTWTDSAGVDRVGSLLDLPYISLRCQANGHRWDDPMPGLDGKDRYRCDCGRRKVEQIDATGAIVSRQYYGGTMLATEARVSRDEARAELRRRRFRRYAGGLSAVA